MGVRYLLAPPLRAEPNEDDKSKITKSEVINLDLCSKIILKPPGEILSEAKGTAY
jgi:hypothetical protein